MSTRILSAGDFPELQPSHALLAAYQPAEAPFAFTAANAAAARAWQHRARPALADLLRVTDRAASLPEAELIETVDRGDYLRHKLLLRIAPDVASPLYLLIPKDSPVSPPVVIAFAGHGYGVKDIVGLRKDGSERDEPEGYHKDFGVALCRRGFAVAAPEIACFGERQDDYSYLDTDLGQPVPSTCARTAALANHLGWSVIGLRALDALRLVDYIESRKDLDASRIGAMGISGGGMHTLFSTCLDDRIRACVVSGYFCTFRDSILAMSHCPCNFVPGLAAFGEMHDLVGLIAPRPMLVEAGDLDPIFPIGAVRSSVDRAREVYQVFDAPGFPVLDEFHGSHQISGALAYDFLAQHLGLD